MEGALDETEFFPAGLSPGRPPGAKPAEGPTMVVPGPLAVSLLLPSLTLLVSQLSSSQDISSELNSEQQLCAQKEHPIVAFEGESTSIVLEDLGQSLGVPSRLPEALPVGPETLLRIAVLRPGSSGLESSDISR